MTIAQRAPIPRTHWPRLIIIAMVGVGAISLVVIHALGQARADADLVRDARATAQLQLSVLQSELDKQRSAPVILADDSDVIDALAAPSPGRTIEISKKLEKLQAETKSAVIYLLNTKGVAISASNYGLPTSFVGSDYSFRDYFRDALAAGQAEQFALGTVSRRPGLYLAHRVQGNGRFGGKTYGVVVVKVEFDAMEAAWQQTGAHAGQATFVTNAAGDILLTSNPRLRFHKSPRPGPAEVETVLPAPADGWRLHLMTSRQDADRASAAVTVIAGMAELLLIILVAWLWRRRAISREREMAEVAYRENLERDVAARTAELRSEIHERQQAERRLNVLQADLVQANKLAQLGQITAGVAHEINQPLATIRVLAENSLAVGAAKPALVSDNLGNIVRMSERIGHITGELRAFSRKASFDPEPVSLKETLDSSVLLNRSRLRDNKVRLVRDPIDAKLRVMAGRVRLEQVLVNLLQNAFEALEDTPGAEVRLSVTFDDDWVWLRVADNGPGLKPEVLAQLFTPFVTTKEKGLGLGLVIAHDILRDFGGELLAESSDKGAVFTLKLRKVTL
jgi:two-component system C4-dicarboxylate transport sensor histidine kinase DctB